MKLLVILIALLTFGCSSLKEVQRVKFNYSVHGKQNFITMNIPKSAKLVKLTAGGEGEEHRYTYTDSSVLYITSLSGSATLNETLINSSVDSYNKRFNADTASFSGIDKKGLCWKEIKYYNLFYGYSRVPPDKKMVFEKALSSVKE
jgi:hypothetical protein